MLKTYISKLPDEGDYEEIIVKEEIESNWNVTVSLQQEDVGEEVYQFVDYKFKKENKYIFLRRYLDVETEIVHLNDQKNATDVDVDFSVSWIRKRDGVTRLK